MDMGGYTKLFSSIVTSTVWREPSSVRLVWITMLALSDKNGIVEASVPGLADMARVSREDCDEALARLSSPDPDSRTQDHEGRRIRKVDGGWALINHAKYREKMSLEERRDKNATYMRSYRKGERKRDDLQVGEVGHAEASPDAEAKAGKLEYPAEFESIWTATGKIGVKFNAHKAWAKGGKPTSEVVRVSWASYMRSQRPVDGYVQDLSTWLNARGWEQEWPEAKNVASTRSQGHQATCGFHGSRFNGGKRAPRHAPACPDCREWEAANRARDSRVETSEDVIKRLGLGDGS